MSKLNFHSLGILIFIKILLVAKTSWTAPLITTFSPINPHAQLSHLLENIRWPFFLLSPHLCVKTLTILTSSLSLHHSVWKSQKKVSFSSASEESYIYTFLSGQKFSVPRQLVENAIIEKLKWDILVDFQTLWKSEIFEFFALKS